MQQIIQVAIDVCCSFTVVYVDICPYKRIVVSVLILIIFSYPCNKKR